jgi:hypothetical protein
MSDEISDDSRKPGFYSPGCGARSEMVAMAAVVVIGTMGIIWLSFKVSRPDHNPANEPGRGASDLTHSEVDRIFVPKALEELARSPTNLAALDTDDSIQRWLQQHGLEKAWYAITFRQFQKNGEHKWLTTHCRPYENPTKVLEFRYVLEALSGDPPTTPLVDYSTAEIVVIPPEIAAKEPAGAIAELMEMPR